MKRLTLILYLIGVLTLSACLSPGTPAIERLGVANAELNYVSSFDINDPFAAVIAGAVAEYEAISGNRVNIIWNGGESAEEVHARMTSGMRVDIWDGDIHNQMKLNTEFMLDLTGFYEASYAVFGNQAMSDIINPFLMSFVEQMSRRYALEDSPDSLLAVPFAPYNVAFVYNQAIFSSAGITSHPRTWDEFLGICERLRTAGYMPLSGQMRPNLAYGYYLARTMGVDWVEDLMHNPHMWTDPSVFRMAQSFELLSRTGSVSRHEDRVDPGPHAILDGRLAMWLMRTSDIRDLVESHSDGTTFGAFNFPRIEGERGDLDRLVENIPEDKLAVMHGSHGFFISRDTRFANYAFEMIATILSPNFDQQLSVETSGVPFASDIPWPPEIRGIERSFNEIGAWIPYGGGTMANPYTRERANDNFRDILRGRAPTREFITEMMRE